MARQNRVVIKHPTLGYYSQCKIVGTKKTIETDTNNNDSVHNRHVLKPIFDSKSAATPFGDAESAEIMMKHSHLEDPNAFEGCVIEPEEE
jgi:hypothetical protein